MVIVDTDIFVDYFRGVEAAKEFMKEIPLDERSTTDINLMELYKGARNEDRSSLANGSSNCKTVCI